MTEASARSRAFFVRPLGEVDVPTSPTSSAASSPPGLPGSTGPCPRRQDLTNKSLAEVVGELWLRCVEANPMADPHRFVDAVVRAAGSAVSDEPADSASVSGPSS
jgi:hypothetical protein